MMKMVFLFAFVVAALMLGAVGWWYYDSSNSRHSTRVIPIANTNNNDRWCDVVFVHGLGGDGLETWTCSKTGFCWPKELGKAEKQFGIWTVDYDANVSGWLGGTASIEDRSGNLLTALSNVHLGDRPIVFIGHSLGGLMIKQMLRDAAEMENPAWPDVAGKTRAVVFVATPHNGSDIANIVGRLGKVFRITVTNEELKKNESKLRNLNNWFRNTSAIDVKVLSFFEQATMDITPIVDAGSADPGIKGSLAVLEDADHIAIAKPCEKSSLVYDTTWNFLKNNVFPIPTVWDVSLTDFLEEFSKVRYDDELLAVFKEEHCNQQVTWKGVICRKNTDPKLPSYVIGESATSDARNRFVAGFRPTKFDPKIAIGTPVQIQGIISRETGHGNIILENCEFAEPR